MDYDGAGQQQLTRLASITLSPRLSPDGARVAFSTFNNGGVQLGMSSLELGRPVAFPTFGGTTLSPAGSAHGSMATLTTPIRRRPKLHLAAAAGSIV